MGLVGKMLTELPFEILSRFELGPLTALYLKDGDKVALALIPAGTEGEIPAHRKLLNDTTACRGFAERNKATVKASSLESMAQAYLRGDARPASGLAGGTLRNGGTANAFKFVKQESDGSTIKTFFENERGVGIEHSLKYEAGRAYVELGSALVNGSKEDVDLDFLESFSLGMLSPFQPDDGPDKYVLHRFRSSWSAEGRHVAESIEDLGLEEPWAPFSGRTLRFGQRSSQIVKEFFRR
jgi:alpha-galactosidase